MNKTNHPASIKQGMTLVEIMIVIAILGLLISLGVPGYIRSREKARMDACVNNLRMIEHAADQYRIDENLTTVTPVQLVRLWPSSTTAKSITSYINKQLFCPNGGFYRGGSNAGVIQTDLEANGVPNCTTTAAGTTVTNTVTGYTDFPHRIN